MAEPFIGEVRSFSFGVVPKGWAQCQGQLLNIQQNAALYSLLGVQFGGDGKTTFGLPDLRGRVPVHRNPTQQDYIVGAKGGSEAVQLATDNVPPHTHSAYALKEMASVPSASGAMLAEPAPRQGATPQMNRFGPAATLQPLAPDALGHAGASQTHNNMQPGLTLNFCIATAGIYPMRPY